MGNTQSLNKYTPEGDIECIYTLPNFNKYTISYCKQNNFDNTIKEGQLKESIDLSSSILFDNNLVYCVILEQVNKLGYSLKKVFQKPIPFNTPLNEIIKSYNSFMSSDCNDTLNDLIIKNTCHYATLDNIKKILNNFNVIIAGIIIDHDLIKSITNHTSNTPISSFKQTTDIVCIVGYNSSSILLKTNWTDKIIHLNTSFIENIKEIWNIDIKSPEDFVKIDQLTNLIN